MKKKRLDEKLIKDGVVKNKQEAFVVVTEGRVFIDGQKAISPAQFVTAETRIEVKRGREFVGRGAFKLQAALEHFGIDVKGKICADIGTSTGGFTQVLLKYGARKVYAIDTAKGKLDLTLREDPRVVVMEETDVRDLAILPDRIDLVTIDVSLISLRDIVSHAGRFLSHVNSARSDKPSRNTNAPTRMATTGEIIALFKPQYETQDPSLLHHGVLQDSVVRERLLGEFLAWAEKNHWNVIDQIESPIRGSEGNVEYLIHLISKS